MRRIDVHIERLVVDSRSAAARGPEGLANALAREIRRGLATPAAGEQREGERLHAGKVAATVERAVRAAFGNGASRPR
jgi:hypothetical protein